MIRRLLVFVGSTLFVWLILAYPAQRLLGVEALVYTATAAGLCLLPASVTLLWAHGASRQHPEQFLMMALGGAGVRMAFVLGTALALFFLVPAYFQNAGFLIALIVFYLLTLSLEMILILSAPANKASSPPSI